MQPTDGHGDRPVVGRDKRAWYLLFYLIPFIGGIILIVFWATDSTRGTNQYGTSEKYPS